MSELSLQRLHNPSREGGREGGREGREGGVNGCELPLQNF